MLETETDTDATEGTMSSMTSAILHRISSDPTFAVLVQSLDIRAYKRIGQSTSEQGEH